MSNPQMRLWDATKRPPESALKTIKGGRLSGMTDISPQWRYQVMTEQLGPCGVGWSYTIDRLWTEQPAPGGEVLAFALVSVRVRRSDGVVEWSDPINGMSGRVRRSDGVEWSDPVPGIGGSKLLSEEKNGLRANDEGYKMAVTDALGTALKMLGVAADIYAGRWDGTKYRDEAPEPADDGYLDWISSLEEFAAKGTAALLLAIKSEATPEAWRARLRSETKTWNALKAKAEQVPA